MKKVTVLSLAAFLTGCGGAGPVYRVEFNGAGLCCTVLDALPFKQDMQEGKSNLPGQYSVTYGESGVLQLETWPPQGTPSDVSSTVGVYRTGVDFGPDKAITLSAVLQKPTRQLTEDPWSLLLVMRNDNSADDNGTTPRIQLSMRTISTETQARSVSLRVQEGRDAIGAKLLGSAKAELTGTAALADIDASKPFTLNLTVNRVDGIGLATLVTDNQTIELNFTPVLFGQNAGERVHTVGVTLANQGVATPARVRVRHFEIISN
jgi:hypothetical protein